MSANNISLAQIGDPAQRGIVGNLQSLFLISIALFLALSAAYYAYERLKGMRRMICILLALGLPIIGPIFVLLITRDELYKNRA